MANIRIEELSQTDADSFMKSLTGKPVENFCKAFHEERKRKEEQWPVWALPLSERLYYLVSLDGLQYLFVGINPNPSEKLLNISSLAKTDQSGRKKKAALCLRVLTEERLIPMCREKTKEAIVAYLQEPDALKVSRSFRRRKPRGIKDISIIEKVRQSEVSAPEQGLPPCWGLPSGKVLACSLLARPKDRKGSDQRSQPVQQAKY